MFSYSDSKEVSTDLARATSRARGCFAYVVAVEVAVAVAAAVATTVGVGVGVAVAESTTARMSPHRALVALEGLSIAAYAMVTACEGKT